MRHTLLILLSMLCIQSGFSQSTKKIAGIYVGITQSTFFRSNLPSNPFQGHSLIAWEVGGNFLLYEKSQVSGRAMLGYTVFGAQENFSYGTQRIESKISSHALKISLLPAIYSFGSEAYQFSIGLGGYASYSLSTTYDFGEFDDVFIDEDRWKALLLGLQAQVGVSYQRYILNLNVYNSLNNMADAFIGEAILKSKGSSLTLTYLF